MCMCVAAMLALATFSSLGAGTRTLSASKAWATSKLYVSLMTSTAMGVSFRISHPPPLRVVPLPQHDSISVSGSVTTSWSMWPGMLQMPVTYSLHAPYMYCMYLYNGPTTRSGS